MTENMKNVNTDAQFYIRDATGFPVSCVHLRAYVDESTKEPYLAVGLSFHNPKDRFNRKLGSDIARGRCLSIVDSSIVDWTVASLKNLSIKVRRTATDEFAFRMPLPASGLRNLRINELVLDNIRVAGSGGLIKVPARVMKIINKNISATVS